eukprot:NODE_6380_length_852_cov_200.562414_g6144_i0.p2 GENE.NODE_6380_length_852_cov_200.562414_g6144_i0~~NODE_6380_length_852_cov_200.562414_g6144_i0.p2  ORF type:complete len:138 (-),score=54.54 NODE_6380_length_852_cov_200.562414_g6144_i0:242-655(-)
MKADYEVLEKEYENSKSVVIADVDCTVEKDLCGKHDVNGYPTIKYWEDGERKDYSSGRSLDDLRAFITETLDKSKCDVNTLADCSKKEKKYIEKVKSLTADQIKEKLEEVNKLKGNKFVKDPAFVGQRIAILKQLQK